MKTKLIIALLVGCIGLVLASYKVEEIEEVCALTGASQRYTRYFSLFSTEPVLQESWVDEVLERTGNTPTRHEWVRTKGDTSTLTSFYRAHQRVPTTYRIRSGNWDDLKERFTDEEIIQLALDFSTGIPDRQQTACDRYDSK